MNIGELFVKLGFDADEQAVKSFEKSIGDLTASLGVIVTTTTAALVALDKFTDGTLRSVAAIRSMSMQSGISMQDLKRWGLAANMSDVTLSAESAMQSIQALQNNLTQIRLGSGNVAPFQMLGIDTTGKNAIQVLNDMRGAIKGLNNSTATNLISQTGLSPQFISLLRLGSDEYSKLNKQLLLSGEQNVKVMQVANAFNTLKINLQLLTDQAVAKMTPELNKLIDSFSQFAPYFIKAVSKILEFGARLATTFIRVAKIFKEWGGYLPLIAGGALVFNTALATMNKEMLALFINTGRVMAIMLALFGLLEDIQVWKKGGQSLIGDLFGPYKKEYDWMLNTLKYGGEAAGGAWTGAKVGGIVGPEGVPIGAGIGALLGPLSDIIMHNLPQSNIHNAKNSSQSNTENHNIHNHNIQNLSQPNTENIQNLSQSNIHNHNINNLARPNIENHTIQNLSQPNIQNSSSSNTQNHKTNSDNKLTFNIQSSESVDKAAINSLKLAFSGAELILNNAGV